MERTSKYCSNGYYSDIDLPLCGYVWEECHECRTSKCMKCCKATSVARGLVFKPRWLRDENQVCECPQVVKQLLGLITSSTFIFTFSIINFPQIIGTLTTQNQSTITWWIKLSKILMDDFTIVIHRCTWMKEFGSTYNGLGENNYSHMLRPPNYKSTFHKVGHILM